MKSKEIFKMLGAVLMFAVITACLYGCKNKIQPQSSIPTTTNVHPTNEGVQPTNKYATGVVEKKYINIGDQIPYCHVVENEQGKTIDQMLFYYVTDINIYDKIDNFDNWIGDPGGRYIRNGKLSRHYKYVVVDIEVYCADASAGTATQHIDIFSLESQGEEKVTGIWSFAINNNRRIGEYEYTLPEGQTERLRIGFLCPAKAIEKNLAYIRVNDGVETDYYIKLGKW